MQRDEEHKRSEAELVREYIVCCPHVRRDNPLLEAALHGLEREVKRMERDKKLKSKFVVAASPGTRQAITHERNPMSIRAQPSVPNQTCAPQGSAAHAASDDDWQEVSNPAPNSVSTYLAARAVAGLASGEVHVKTPFGAIFVALNALLVSEELLGFTGLGVPQGKNSKGFARPIRDSGGSKYFPANWTDDASQSMVSCRYRTNDFGTVTLHLFFNEHEREMQIDFAGNDYFSGDTKHLSFPIKKHVNLSSFQAALDRDGKVKPSLHYKSLPQLMNDVVTKFGLSSVSGGHVQQLSGSKRDLTQQSQLPYVDASAAAMAAAASTRLTLPASSAHLSIPAGYPTNLHTPPTLQVFRPGHLNSPGDFASDLHPPGLTGPFMGGYHPSAGGNLMGPGHPMFAGGPAPFPGGGGGYGMQPRFDPFGPPGGPQDPRNHQQPGNLRIPPGGMGNPNPDHQRAPNDLSNNMFM